MGHVSICRVLVFIIYRRNRREVGDYARNHWRPPTKVCVTFLPGRGIAVVPGSGSRRSPWHLSAGKFVFSY